MGYTPIKDWLYFSRRERKGIVLLIAAIVLMPIVSTLGRHLYSGAGIDSERVKKEAALFNERLSQSTETPAPPERFGARPLTAEGLRPRPFDPNHLSKDEWEAMGLPSYLSEIIGNYLSAGGNFRYKDDLSKIYFMSRELYEVLEPYILLPDRPVSVGSISRQNVSQGKGEPRPGTMAPGSEPQPALIDINLADSMAFRRLRGIGPVFARRIVRYRELLGGYHRIDQLMEVYGMDSIRYGQIRDYLFVSPDHVRKLDLNQAGFAELIRHPYLDRETVTAILNLRRQHGPFESAADIRQSHLIDQANWERIAPYLSAGGSE